MDSVSLPTVGLSDPKAKRPTGRTFLQVMPARIIKYAQLRGVTISALAKAAKISRSTLTEILGGQRPQVKVVTIERICHALGVSADALFGFNSVALVRTPRMGGLPALVEGDAAWGLERQCAMCMEVVPPRVLHTQTDCIVEMSNNGESDSKIGSELGLSTKVIACALLDSVDAQRHWMNAA